MTKRQNGSHVVSVPTWMAGACTAAIVVAATGCDVRDSGCGDDVPNPAHGTRSRIVVLERHTSDAGVGDAGLDETSVPVSDAITEPTQARWMGAEPVGQDTRLRFEDDGEPLELVVGGEVVVPRALATGDALVLEARGAGLVMTDPDTEELVWALVRGQSADAPEFRLADSHSVGRLSLEHRPHCGGLFPSGEGCSRDFCIYDLTVRSDGNQTTARHGRASTIPVEGAVYRVQNRLVAQRGDCAPMEAVCADLSTPRFDIDVALQSADAGP
ncbi:MAG: hypothetical protein ACOCUS_03620 [Polyangiales bacterium]